MWSKSKVFNSGNNIVRHSGQVCLPVNLPMLTASPLCRTSLTKVGLKSKSTGGGYGREKEVRPS